MASSFFIAQHSVRFIQRLHFFFRAAAIRMPLVRLSLIQSLDLARRILFARADNCIVVFVNVELIQLGSAL